MLVEHLRLLKLRGTLLLARILRSALVQFCSYSVSRHLRIYLCRLQCPGSQAIEPDMLPCKQRCAQSLRRPRRPHNGGGTPL